MVAKLVTLWHTRGLQQYIFGAVGPKHYLQTLIDFVEQIAIFVAQQWEALVIYMCDDLCPISCHFYNDKRPHHQSST